MRVGDPVRVREILVEVPQPPPVRMPSSGKRGHVVETHSDHVMAVLDDDPRPLRFGRDELVPLERSTHHGGAE